MKDDQALLLGIDLGTTATKAALYRLDGSLVGEGRANVMMTHPAPGCVEQSMTDFYGSAAEATRNCLSNSGADPQAVVALAFDSQMAGVGALDDRFQPAGHFDSWLDMRCRPFIEELTTRHQVRITELTGCPPTCAHGPKMLWWQHERPADYARISKFVMPVCYVAGRMAGLQIDDAFIDYTFLHFSGCSDASRGTWSEELCSTLGIDQNRLPRIVEPWQLIGEVNSAAARDFGLREGTPIAAGCGDTAAGALGAGVVRAGMLLDTAGTASVLGACTDQYFADTEHSAVMVMRSVAPGMWTSLAYIGGGGLALPWFCEKMLEGSHSNEIDSATYDQLFAGAETVAAGCDGLLFSPHLGGRICPAAPSMRGAWIGFTWRHTRAHFFRAIAEGVAYEYAWYLKIIRKMLPGTEFHEARVIGGGAKSTAWNRIKASVLGVPYRQVSRSESATWGCALIAAKAVGLIDDIAIAALESAPVCRDVTVPDIRQRAAYDKAFHNYLYWQEKLKDGFDHTQIPTV
jgi:xylulokinase